MAEQFDLEGYISNYSGLTKVMRLLFIAEHSLLPEVQVEAFRSALKELRHGMNTSLYREAHAKAVERFGSQQFEFDQSWVDHTDRSAAIKQERLDQEMTGYKTNLIKESIRMGYNDQADFFYSRGEIQLAFKCYVRTRDYCATPKHTITMCLNVILVSSQLGQFANVANYVQKAEQTPDLQDNVIIGKLKAAAGLANLEAKKYKNAARKFVDVNVELGSNYSEMISPQDVATYGGLCALASFDRAELKSKVIDNINFKNFLELVPEVRELVHDFYASRYASCLRCLDGMKQTLLLDIHLHDHLETLYQNIRHKALIQYTAPFISVNLQTMAAAFDTSVTSLEDEIATLIVDNQIQARIDSQNKILYARHADQRNATFQSVVQLAATYEKETRAAIIRSSLLRNEIVSGNGKALKLPIQLF